MADNQAADVDYSAYSDGMEPAAPAAESTIRPTAGNADVLSTVKQPSFILYALEWLFAVIVMATASSFESRLIGGSGFVIFVGVFAFLAATAFMALSFFGHRLGAVSGYQPIATFMFAVVWSFLFFVAGIVMAANVSNIPGILSKTSASSAAAFSFLSVPLWLFTAYQAFRKNTVPIPLLTRFQQTQPTVSV
jgi:uncharacterized membrane protein